MKAFISALGMQFATLSNNCANNRFANTIMKVFCILIILIASTPFIDTWYENRLQEELYITQEKYQATQESISHITAMSQNGLLPDKENMLYLDLLNQAVIHSSKAAEIAEELQKRASNEFVNMSWWWSVPVAAAPASFYAAYIGLFKAPFDVKQAIWTGIIIAFLALGLLGYWFRKSWGALAMGIFCLLYGSGTVFEMFGSFAPDISVSLTNLLLLPVLMIPALFVRSNKLDNN